MQHQVSPLKDAVPREAQFEGALLSARYGEVSGWAWDRRDPTRSVEVEIFADGVRLGRATADGFDGRQPGAVTGPHSFKLRVSPGLLAPPYTVRARVVDSACELDRAIQVNTRPEHLEVLVGYAGTVTGISGGAIEGWAVSKADHSERVTVELQSQGEVLATVVANRPMPATPDFGAGHGFRLAIPLALLDGAVHRVSVKVAGDGFELGSSPLPLGLLATDGILDRVEQLEAEVERLRRQSIDREARIGAQTEQMGSDLSRRLDALLLIQRNAFEQEMAVLRRFIGDEAVLRRPEAARPASAEVTMDDSLIGYGWHGSERDDRGPFRWMANSGTVVVDFSTKSSARLKLKVHHILDLIHKDTIQVDVNGEPVSDPTWKQGDLAWVYEAVVPASAFRGRSCAVVTLRSEFARAASKDDSRELSVALQSVRLESRHDA